MKKVLVVAGLGAALATAAVLGAGTASANSTTFLSQLHAQGWYNPSVGDSGLLDQGHQVCTFLYQGYSESSVVNWVYHHTGPSVGVADASQFVRLAENHLC